MSSSEANRLKELEKENARLKKLLAEQALGIDILKEVIRNPAEEFHSGCTPGYRKMGVTFSDREAIRRVRYESGKLLSPAQRRKAVIHVRETFELSERRACQAVDQPRSTQRYAERRTGIDGALSCRMNELSKENPRYGYRRVWALLRREGWEVNKKRVLRLWREQGLKVPKKQHKSRRLAGSGENGVGKRSAEYPGHVWSYDFAMGSTQDGRRLKVMPVMDEYTREYLSLEGQRSIKAEGIIDTLRRLFIERGQPTYARSDTGPEFIAEGLKEWLALSGAKTPYIEPGGPWENAYSETFIGRLRDELLERELFVNLKEAQVLLEDYRKHYNHKRPHGALGYLTSAEFAAIEALTGRGPGPSEQLKSVQRLSL